MISLAEIALDPDFAQVFTVTRSNGQFGQGGFLGTTTTLPDVGGIIQPASDEDIAQVPEGDRVTGMLSFITQLQLYKTHTLGIGTPSGLGDTITWRGQVYKIVHTTPWADFGFWKAIGSRQSGA